VELRKVRLLDLTLAELAQVEELVGVRMSSWGDPAVMRSEASLQGALLAVGNGVPLEEVMALTMPQVNELVDTEGTVTPDPTAEWTTPTQT
jgi:hypothetical protein